MFLMSAGRKTEVQIRKKETAARDNNATKAGMQYPAAKVQARKIRSYETFMRQVTSGGRPSSSITTKTIRSLDNRYYTKRHNNVIVSR